MRKFVYIRFELVGVEETQSIIDELQTAGMKFDVIVADVGEIIGSYSEKVKFKKFEKTAQDIVWKHNNGCYCEVTERTYESVEQYL